MNVLVTGGAGYVGSVVVEVLLREGCSVVVVDNLKEGHRSALSPNVPFVQADIGNRDSIKKTIRENDIEAVIHMAGETLVTKSMTHPEDYFINNVSKGIELLEALRETGVKRIIFSSTAALFGNPQFTPITEEHPAQPINAYGRSKLMFEEMLEWYHTAHGLNYVCLRYFNAAGATELHGECHRIETHLIPLVLDVALGKREQVSMFGADYETRDGTCIRDYIHIDDLGRAHVAALRHMDTTGPQKLNMGNGSGYSVKEVIEAARRVTGKPIKAVHAPRRAGDPAVLVASSARAQRLLQWTPRYPTIEQIVESAWKWHVKYPGGYPD
ncbi:MAG: UDP-glucose 4-epimerase GalE [bacterium]